MSAWQQYQRLKFEFKERSLPLDGSYKPPTPAGGWPPRAKSSSGSSSAEPGGLYRSTSVPVLAGADGGPRNVSAPSALAQKALNRGMSGMLNKPRNGSVAVTQSGSPSGAAAAAAAGGTGWARASSPSIDLGGNSPQMSRPKSGSFSTALGRRGSVSMLPQVGVVAAGAGGNSSGGGGGATAGAASPESVVPKVKSMADTFEKAKQHLNDGLYEKAMSCFSEVIIESLVQRALCLIQMEEYSEAVVNCDFALHFKPGHGKALIRKCKALVKLDRQAEAKACRAVAVSYLRPDDPELWEVGAMLGLNEVAPPQQQQQQQQQQQHHHSQSQHQEEDEISSDEPTKAQSPPELSGRAVGRGNAPRPVSTTVARGTPSTARKESPREEIPPTSPPSSKKLPQPPGPGARGSALLKKPAMPAPVAPKRNSAQVPKTKDPLDLSYDYSAMEDHELPHLPSDPPSIDDDLARWQQYQRLKTEYRDRELEPRFA